MTRLVVTADDLGLSSEVTRGVIAAHRVGVVRSASLLVTFPASEEGAALGRAESALEIGLHLDLVEGWPVSDARAVSSLVDDEGRFHPLGTFFARLATGRIRGREIAAELRAQVARARAWGTPALAWDSHRHTHAHPLLARVVGAVARELSARWIRRPAPARVWRSRKSFALGLATWVSRPAYGGIPGNDWYVDLSSWPADATAVALLATYDGVGEIGAHPGAFESERALLSDPLLVAAFGGDVVGWRVP